MQLLGHRGAKHIHLENTMPAFQAALDAGLDGIELDVQRCRDGTLVVHHDFHLPDGRLIAALEFSELRLDGYIVPTLEEVLVWAKKTGAFINVEIKLETIATDGREHGVATFLERMSLASQTIVSSFNPLSLWRIKRLAPNLDTALLFDNQSAPHWLLDHGRLADVLGVSALHPHHSLVTPALMARAKNKHWAVNVWTVNDASTAQRLQQMGVNSLIGDYPEVLLATRALQNQNVKTVHS